MIPYARQNISKEDINFVKKILKSEYLTSGPATLRFEKKVAKYCSSKFAIATNSGTSALHISCLSLNLKKGDYVWTSPISFVASANCAFYFGAKVDFVDINEESFNIDVNKLKKKLEIAKKKNRLPKVLVVVHLGGNPCELSEIKKLSKKYKFFVIEDASHALGAKYNKIKIGNPKYSDVSILSFHPVKMITTGEGGALLTNSKNIDNKFKILRSHGIVKEKKYLQNKNLPKWYYEQRYLSSNYRMTSFQAALGISQLKKISTFTKIRNKLAQIYEKKLSGLPIRFQKIKKNSISSRHLFIILVEDKIRNKLYSFLDKNNIQTNLHYIPIYRHPFYKKFNFNKKNFKNAEKYYSKALSIPLHVQLSNKDQNFIIAKIKDFFKNN